MSTSIDQQNLAFDFGENELASSNNPEPTNRPSRVLTGVDKGAFAGHEVAQSTAMVPSRSPRGAEGTQTVSKGAELVPDGAEESAACRAEVAKGSELVPEGAQEAFQGSELVPDGAEESAAFGVEVTKGSAQVLEGAQEVAKGAAKVPQKAAGGTFGIGAGLKGSEVVSIGTVEANKSPSKVAKGAQSGLAKGAKGRNQAYEINPNVILGETFFDIDPPKRRNAGYRVRRDLVQERQIDMPLFITGVEIRAGIAQDDRHWNQKFVQLREQIVKEIGDLRFVIGDRMAIEVSWNLPLNWPYVALRAPDGRRLVETDSAELGSYGLRSVTMLWKSIVEKQKAMQTMARNYAAMLRWSEKLRTKVPVAMDGSRACRLLLDPEIHKQINSLEWPSYLRDSAGGAFSPLPFNVYESMRVRLWAHVKAVKQHVHAMNLNYNRVTNEKRASLGKTRGAALAVAIMDGPARTPQHYWALWVRKGQENLFYKVVTPRFFSLERGKYITTESFDVSDSNGRLHTYAIDRCHLTHMKDLYRAADHVLADLLALSQKTADLLVETVGKRHGKESTAASGRGSWRGSGVLFRWIPGQ
ncbi:hypothetical protein MCEMSEM18_03477 [Comamonadaceae bacterium]